MPYLILKKLKTPLLKHMYSVPINFLKRVTKFAWEYFESNWHKTNDQIIFHSILTQLHFDSHLCSRGIGKYASSIVVKFSSNSYCTGNGTSSIYLCHHFLDTIYLTVFCDLILRNSKENCHSKNTHSTLRGRQHFVGNHGWYTTSTTYNMMRYWTVDDPICNLTNLNR